MTERQPRLVREVAERVRVCGAAISRELQPLIRAVRECQGRMEEVDDEAEAIADLIRDLDPGPTLDHGSLAEDAVHGTPPLTVDDLGAG